MSKKKTGTYANDIIDDLLDDELEELKNSSEENKLVLTEDEDTVQLSGEDISVSSDDVEEEISAAEVIQPDDIADILAIKGDTEFKTQHEIEKGESISEKVKTSVGRFFSTAKSGDVSPTGAKLAQSESLRLAQERILFLETKVADLRSENEQLIAAGETLQRRAEELMGKQERSDARVREQKQYFEDERKILQESINSKDRQISEVKQKLEESDARLSANMQKIRIREKELENRLELVKMESSALLNNKNELILDLKKNIDRLNMELEGYRSRGQDLIQQLDQKQDTLKRTVRTLRMALTMIEGADIDSEEES